MAIALSGQPKPIDLIALTVDDQPVQHFAVMGGVGIDAVIMDETDPNLKEKVVRRRTSWPLARRSVVSRCAPPSP